MNLCFPERVGFGFLLSPVQELLKLVELYCYHVQYNPLPPQLSPLSISLPPLPRPPSALLPVTTITTAAAVVTVTTVTTVSTTLSPLSLSPLHWHHVTVMSPRMSKKNQKFNLAQFQVSPWQTKYSQLLVTEIESI
jgi:hypothetical protein